MKGGGEEGGRGGGEKETEGDWGCLIGGGTWGRFSFVPYLACKLLRTANYRRSVLKPPFPSITAKQRKGRETQPPTSSSIQHSAFNSRSVTGMGFDCLQQAG
jgi:hypothetical protein